MPVLDLVPAPALLSQITMDGCIPTRTMDAEGNKLSNIPDKKVNAHLSKLT